MRLLLGWGLPILLQTVCSIMRRLMRRMTRRMMRRLMRRMTRANDAANDAAIDAAIDAASDAANDYRRAGLPFPLPETQGWVAFPAVWTQGALESRECGKVCEITVGLGCLYRYGGRAGMPIPLPETQGWVAFPAVWMQRCVGELRAEDMEVVVSTGLCGLSCSVGAGCVEELRVEDVES